MKITLPHNVAGKPVKPHLKEVVEKLRTRDYKMIDIFHSLLIILYYKVIPTFVLVITLNNEYMIYFTLQENP